MFLFEWIENFSSVKPSDPCAEYWPVEKRDYSYLIGKKFMYMRKIGPDTEGIVDMIDYDIGISTSDIQNRKKHLTCINGESSKIRTTKNYHEYFLYAIAQIESGTYNPYTTPTRNGNGNGGGLQCGFSQ